MQTADAKCSCCVVGNFKSNWAAPIFARYNATHTLAALHFATVVRKGLSVTFWCHYGFGQWTQDMQQIEVVLGKTILWWHIIDRGTVKALMQPTHFKEVPWNFNYMTWNPQVMMLVACPGWPVAFAETYPGAKGKCPLPCGMAEHYLGDATEDIHSTAASSC